MSKESMLQKEFKERDVERMRNIISKKYNNSTGVQSGYKKEDIERNEGDTWMENGKQWTIKNGLKITISKLDLVKKTVFIPLSCPCCNKPMGNDTLNKKMYHFHKKCFSCVIEYETKLRQEGKFEEYQRNIMSKNIDAYVNELNDIFSEVLTSTEEKVVTEDGNIENWVGGAIDKEKLKKEYGEYIELLNKTKAQL